MKVSKIDQNKYGFDYLDKLDKNTNNKFQFVEFYNYTYLNIEIYFT